MTIGEPLRTFSHKNTALSIVNINIKQILFRAVLSYGLDRQLFPKSVTRLRDDVLRQALFRGQGWKGYRSGF